MHTCATLTTQAIGVCLPWIGQASANTQDSRGSAFKALPARIRQTELKRGLGVLSGARAVHRLQQVVLKSETFDSFDICWQKAVLRIDQLQFVPRPLQERRPRLRANANPVEAVHGLDCSVGLYSDLEPAVMQRINQSPVDLQEWFTARQHYVWTACQTIRPCFCNELGQTSRIMELPAHGPIGAYEICVAELADRAIPVSLKTCPKVATGKAENTAARPALSPSPEGCRSIPLTQEHGRASGMTRARDKFVDRDRGYGRHQRLLSVCDSMKRA